MLAEQDSSLAGTPYAAPSLRWSGVMLALTCAERRDQSLVRGAERRNAPRLKD